MPLDQELFHIGDAGRQLHRDQLGALAGRQRCPARRRDPAPRRRPASRSRGSAAPARPAPASASSSARRTDSGRRRWPGCRCRPPPARPIDRSARSAGSRRRPSDCCAGRSPAWRRSPRAAPSAASVNCTPCTTSVLASIRPWRSRYVTGSHAGIAQSSRHTPIISSMPRHGPLPFSSNSTSSARLAEMHAHDRTRRCVHRRRESP